eukprot:CAMPEP_0201533750 /NCGR_PEP_ID=MMETSP0161_2-20130828/54160_1 /ASSEMBLY_ACC=CAM_ASM_000251 /TAXON_ID=180227 /ORGANISM="Neoparamoeba aestuarina, Strain SoJaBio B1-5/56/2" /LENGTH=47 /DNA_ID= /DNA_START= /DNA_END= /DNA_ORIENTATION=
MCRAASQALDLSRATGDKLMQLRIMTWLLSRQVTHPTLDAYREKYQG